jgi:threonine dehydrogenase-like Zn-dependent dehydrogenase
VKTPLDLLKSGAFDAEALILNVKPLAEAAQAYADASMADNVKTIIHMQAS